jgi:hypothetical protein
MISGSPLEIEEAAISNVQHVHPLRVDGLRWTSPAGQAAERHVCLMLAGDSA